MATIWTKCGEIDLADDDPRVRAYDALSKAADKIGFNNYEAQIRAHRKSRRSERTFQFHVTPEHRAITEAMPQVLDGKISPEDAMALLHGYDTFRQRFPCASST